MKIRDFIYVDTDKAVSIYSQLTGGVVDVREQTRSKSDSTDNKRHYDFKVFKHDAGGSAISGESEKSVIKPHHALLNELEEKLSECGHLIDLAAEEFSENLSDPEFRQKLKKSFCIKARGRALIEDYERIKKISETFPDITAFINRSIAENAGLGELERQLSAAEKGIREIKNRNTRATKQAQIQSLKEQLNVARSAKQIDTVSQWLLDGVAKWIDTYLPGIINLRIYPQKDNTSEHILGSLKRECVEVGDLNYLHYTYGSFPTEDLTIVGIITSVPEQEGELFNPLEEFERENLKDSESVEAGFRRLFRGFDGLEAMIRTVHYPRVLVYPILVYREVA